MRFTQSIVSSLETHPKWEWHPLVYDAALIQTDLNVSIETAVDDRRCRRCDFVSFSMHTKADAWCYNRKKQSRKWKKEKKLDRISKRNSSEICKKKNRENTAILWGLFYSNFFISYDVVVLTEYNMVKGRTHWHYTMSGPRIFQE